MMLHVFTSCRPTALFDKDDVTMIDWLENMWSTILTDTVGCAESVCSAFPRVPLVALGWKALGADAPGARRHALPSIPGPQHPVSCLCLVIHMYKFPDESLKREPWSLNIWATNGPGQTGAARFAVIPASPLRSDADLAP
jgi:hypothetical protein